MNMSLVLCPSSRELRVNFTFDWPGAVLLELKIQGSASGDGRGPDVLEFCRMFDNLKYGQSLFTSCPECDRHQILAILRRSIERARQSPATARISISIKNEKGTTRNLAVTDGDDEILFELDKALRPVAPAYQGHAHSRPPANASRSRDLSVH